MKYCLYNTLTVHVLQEADKGSQMCNRLLVLLLLLLLPVHSHSTDVLRMDFLWIDVK